MNFKATFSTNNQDIKTEFDNVQVVDPGSGGTDLTQEQINNINDIPNIREDIAELRPLIQGVGAVADGAKAIATTAITKAETANAAANTANTNANNALNAIGDIDTALDSIIAIQNELIGGDAV